MHSPDDKKKFLDALEEVPNISAVCRRVGISRSTIYKWQGEDKAFAKAVDRAVSHGRESINDLAEGVVVSRMKKGDLNAARYWLDNNEKRYYRPRRAIPAPAERVQTVDIHVIHETRNPANPEPKRKPTKLIVLSPPPNRDRPANTADSAPDPDTSPKAPEASRTKRGT